MMNYGREDNVMTQRTSNVSSSRSNAIQNNRRAFLEQCKRWRLTRNENEIYYVNMGYLNVFDAFRIASNESAKVTAVYDECGESYKVMPPQIMPLYRYAVREIHKGNDTQFNINVLQVIIKITEIVDNKQDFTGYSIIKHTFKECAREFITMNNWACSIFRDCNIWEYIDDIETERCSVEVTFEHVMDRLKNEIRQKLRIL